MDDHEHLVRHVFDIGGRDAEPAQRSPYIGKVPAIDLVEVGRTPASAAIEPIFAHHQPYIGVERCALLEKVAEHSDPKYRGDGRWRPGVDTAERKMRLRQRHHEVEGEPKPQFLSVLRILPGCSRTRGCG